MLAPWKENYDKSRQSVKKQRRYFADKMLIVKAMVFLVVMYRCENRAIKKAVCQRIGPFELWCWRRLLRVPWTEKRSNQAILKEVNHEYSLERLTMKLKLQYFGHLMQRWKRPWCWERLRAAYFLTGIVTNLSSSNSGTGCQCRRHGFNLCVGKIPWSRKW